MRTTRIVSFVLVLGLVLAACGGSDAAPVTTTTTAPAPTSTAPRPQELIPPAPVTTTTTLPPAHPAAACETPDTALTLEEQRQACLGFLGTWLSQTIQPDAFRVTLWNLLNETQEDGTATLTVVMGATDPQDAELEALVKQSMIAQQPVPEWLISAPLMEEIAAQIKSTTEGIQNGRMQVIGITLLAYASYADLLGVDAVVVRVAYRDAQADSGWVVVDYRIAATDALALTPGTFGDLLQAQVAQNAEQVNAIVEALPKIVAATTQTVVTAPAPAEAQTPDEG